MNLYESLPQIAPLKIAVVGGGGKTTAVFQLARQAAGNAWVSTTTHLGTDQLHLADRHFTLLENSTLDASPWMTQKVTLLTGNRTPDDRVRGLVPELINAVAVLADRENVSLIVEADGARSHPVKAPAEHEPVIPDWVDTVVVVVGLSAIGKPLTSEWVHRAEIYAQLTHLHPGDPISLESVIAMLVSPLGGLKGIPSGACRIVFLNQADLHPLSDAEISLLDRLKSDYNRVLYGSLSVEPDQIHVV